MSEATGDARRAGGEAPIEPDETGRFAGPVPRFETSSSNGTALSRRDLLRTLGGGILVSLAIGESGAATPRTGPPDDGEARNGRRGGFTERNPPEIGAWIHIGEDGAVSVYTGKVEMGQNIRTSLAQAAADELSMRPEAIRLVMGDTDQTPYDGGTSGSRTTPAMAPQIRKAAASAREMLLDLAADEMKVDRTAITLKDGAAVSENHPPVPIGRLTRGKLITKTIDESLPGLPPSRWKAAGASIPKANGRDLVTGRHRYASDLTRPGMLRGKVLRPPAIGAKATSVDLSGAEGMKGVTAVKDGDFIGVTAPDEQTAAAAIEKIAVNWSEGQGTAESKLFDHLKRTGRSGGSDRSAIRKSLDESERRLGATYTIAYIAHAPLEPRAAVAEWKDGKVTVWTGTQRPFGVKEELMEAFGLPPERVRVIVPDTGSGYGGKHSNTGAVEAARLSKSAGKPVKLCFMRDEEFRWAYFRPAGVIEVNAGYTRDGRLTAWEFDNYNSGGSGIATLYEVPERMIEFHASDSPFRQGSYRALAATANMFARESHMGDIARDLSMDPLAFRLKNLKDTRLRGVFEAAAARFGWGKTKSSKGRGTGIAGGFEKGGYVATCAEVGVDDDGTVGVKRVTVAFDCGPVVNPKHLENQIEGMVMMGIGGALFEAIHFENGRVTNASFGEYRVPRFSDVPEIEIVSVAPDGAPSAGAGETPMIAVAPAIRNAILDATGVRLFSLPLAPDGIRRPGV